MTAAVVQRAGKFLRVMYLFPEFESFAYHGLPVGLTIFTVMTRCGENALASGGSRRRAGKDHVWLTYLENIPALRTTLVNLSWFILPAEFHSILTI